MRAATGALLALLLLLDASCGGSTRLPSPLEAEDRADLAWVSTLGLPDLEGKPYVEVTDGGWRDENDEFHPNRRRGFLLEEGTDGTLRVLLPDLTVRIFRLTGEGVAERKQVTRRPLDLGEEAAWACAAFETRSWGAWRFRFESPEDELFGERLGRTSRAFLLAWACHENGLDREARDLLEAARTEDRRDASDDPSSAAPLRERHAGVFEEVLIWRAVEAFGDASFSRSELLAWFASFLAAFPEGEHAETASEAVVLLERMIREDVEHRVPSKPWADLSAEEQAAELIFRLRDQNGGQFMQPGSPSIFLPPDGRRDGDTPADRLVALGYAAVPRLLEALDDERFTRTVGFWRNFTYSHYVVRIGGAARSILQRITGKRFHGQGDSTERWRAWWRQFSEGGVRQGLLAAVARGDPDSVSHARRLLDEAPGDAVRAILQGIENAESAAVHERLVSVLVSVPGVEPLPFLQREVRDGPTVTARLAAARWLHRRGLPAALEAVLREWRAVGDGASFEGSHVNQLAVFLQFVGTDRAAKALVEGFDELGVNVRYKILESGLRLRERQRGDWPPLAPEASRRYEDLLARALDDERLPDESAYFSVTHPEDGKARLCDAAAEALARLQEDGEAFDGRAFVEERDAAIHRLKQAWRARRGLPPLEDPPGPAIARLSSAHVAGMVRTVREAAQGAGRDDAVSALEAEGLAALPALRALLGAAADTDAVEQRLGEAARRMAFTVREVRVLPPGQVLSDEARRAVQRVVGVPLAVDSLVRLVAAATVLLEGGGGMQVRLLRPGDDTGVVVDIEVLPGRGEASAGAEWRKLHTVVYRGRAFTVDVHTSVGAGMTRGPSSFPDLREGLREALDAPPSMPVRALLRLE